MLRFVFGPSGAGKSTTALSELIARSLREPERRFFVLVPDQFTMQAQADVVRMHPKHGIMNVDVLSFSRLAHRVFDETGSAKETLLDDLGKTLLLRYVAGQIKDRIPLIGPHMVRAGYIDEVKSTLSELMQYDITPEKMEALIAASSGRNLLNGKLKDLQTLYAAFRDTIEKKYRTAEDTYTIVERRISETDFAKDAVVVVDGFTGFTPVQYRVLRALYGACAGMTVTVTMGEGEDPYTPEELQDGGIFALGKKTVRDLSRWCYEREAEESPKDTPPFDVWEAHRRKTAGDLFLHAGEKSRLHGNAALSFLERNLFRPDAGQYGGAPGSVRLFAASSPAEEARQVFRAIRRLLRGDDSLQFRDVAVLCADFEAYADVCRTSARDFAIPVYEDATKSIRNNPLNGYLSAIPAILRTGFSMESVMQYMKSSLSFAGREEADLLERYCVANGIRGSRRWETSFLSAPPRDRLRRTDEETAGLLNRLEALRLAFLDRILPLADAAKNGTVLDLTRALYRVMCEDRAEEKLSELADRFEEEGDPAAASEYRQVFSKAVHLLEDIVKLLGEERLSLTEYAQVLEAGLADLNVGTIPQNVDRVLVGDLRRTRLKEVKVLFLCGANDLAIPHRESGGGLLSEIDRDFLRSHCAEVELAPSPPELLATERLYLYMNLTKPSRVLYLSYAAVDAAGKSAQPSYLVADFKRMFPAETVAVPESDPLWEQAETRADASRRMGVAMRRYAAGRQGDTDRSPAVLFRLLADHEQGMYLIRKAAFAGYRKRTLSPELAKALYETVRKTSASRLEKFAECPYAHFVRYGLRLLEKAEYDFNAADLGNVYHGVLERVSLCLARENLSLTDVPDDVLETTVRETVHAFAAEYGNAVLYDTKQMQHRLDRVEQVLLRTVKTLRYQLQQGAFTPSASEAPFSRSVTDGESAMELYGRIDRVDTASDGENTYVKVIDFKSGKRDFDPVLLFYGLQLQLMLYMDAALEQAEKQKGVRAVPAAMLYYHITDPLIDLDSTKADGDNDAEIEALLKKSLRTTGIVNADATVIGLLDKAFEKTSDVIPVTRKKNGELSATSAVFEEDDYAALSAYTKMLTTSFYRRMRQGDIAVAPYELKQKNACTWCAYRAVCAFDETVKGYRFRALNDMKREEVLERVRKETGISQEEEA